MSGHHRNLELKVTCAPTDLDRLRERLDTLTCAPAQRLHQVDTYLQVSRGRLKLRELRRAGEPGTIERAELIAYDRATESGSRWSAYRVIPIAPQAAPDLLAGLLLTHDQLAVVDKVRTVGIIGQTRVHLDEVRGLGAFVELETVLTGQAEEAATAEHRQVIAALGLDRFPVVAGSYGEMAIATDAT
jgi:adenylate cyclase class IV